MSLLTPIPVLNLGISDHHNDALSLTLPTTPIINPQSNQSFAFSILICQAEQQITEVQACHLHFELQMLEFLFQPQLWLSAQLVKGIYHY